MSRRFYVSIFLVFFFITIAICFEPLAVIFIRSQLKKQLSADTVQIGNFQLRPTSARLSDVLVEKSKVFTVKAQTIRVEFRFPDILDKKIEGLTIANASVDYQKVKVEDLDLYVKQDVNDGQLSIAAISYDKGKVTNIKSPGQMKGQSLIFPDLTAEFLNGRIMGNVKAEWAGAPAYYSELRFINLDIARFIDDFELDEKVEMTGLMNGELKVSGSGAKLSILGGHFKMAAPGGKLIIKDRRLLENIVQRAYLETAVETLQDYHYNAGGLQVLLEDNNPAVELNLDGRQGKRNFKIVYHP